MATPSQVAKVALKRIAGCIIAKKVKARSARCLLTSKRMVGRGNEGAPEK